MKSCGTEQRDMLSTLAYSSDVSALDVFMVLQELKCAICHGQV